MTGTVEINRRQVKIRSPWPAKIAKTLASIGMRPNQVSVLSLLFAGVAGVSLAAVHGTVGWTAVRWLVLAAIGIQLRLLCNLLDGLLTAELKIKTKTSPLFNEIPGRLADIVILVGAGYAVRGVPGGVTLGWSAALLAVLTAYVRVLGGALKLGQDFSGPMARKHRMHTLTAGVLVSGVEVMIRGSVWALVVSLGLIVIGAVVTIVRRVLRMVAELTTE